MPLYEDTETGLTEIPAEDPRQGALEEPVTFREVAGVRFRQFNTAVSLAADVTQGQEYEPDPEYRHLEDPANEGYEEYTVEALNEAHASDIRSNVDRQQRDKQLVRDAPLLMDVAASVAAIATDPTTILSLLFPATSLAKAATVGKGLAVGATEGVLVESAVQAALGHSQETLTLSDQALAVAAGGIVGGAVGAFVGQVQKSSLRKAEETVKNIVQQRVRTAHESRSGGAAAVLPGEADEYIAGSRVGALKLGPVGKVINKAMSWMTPGHLLASKSAGSRTFAAEMAEVSAGFEGVYHPAAVESFVKVWHQKAQALLYPLQDARKAYINRTGEKIGEQEFAEKVGTALTRKEVTGHVEVDQMVTRYREEVYDPMTKEAMDLGLLSSYTPEFKKAQKLWTAHSDELGQLKPSEMVDRVAELLETRGHTGVKEVDDFLDDLLEEGVDFRGLRMVGGEEYLNRLYDVPKILQDPKGFKSLLTSEFTRSFKNRFGTLSRRVEKLDEARKGAVGESLARLTRRYDNAVLARQEIEAQLEDMAGLVDQTYATITGIGRGKLPPNLEAGKSGALRARTLDITDDALTPWVVRDINQLSSRFAEQLGADIEIFRRFGTLEFGDVWKQVGARADWEEVKAAAPARKQRQLEVQYKRDEEDAKAIFERIRGLRGWADDASSIMTRTGQMMRAVSFMGMLGKMPISALTDMARPGMVHGFGDTFRISAKMAMDADLRNMSKTGLRRAGAVVELASDNRMLQVAELMDTASFQTSAEKLIHAGTRVFAKATGMVHMNEGFKILTGSIYQDQAARALLRGDWGHRSVKQYGISPEMGARIAGQLRAHKVEYKGVVLPGTDGWTDQRAQSYWNAAVVKAVDETIVTPGVIDRPKFADKEMGKLIMQFRSFGLASNHRTVLSGLTGHSANVYGGVAESIALGTMAYAIKGYLSGRGDEVEKTLTGKDPGKLYNELVANAGFGMLIDGMQSLQRFAGIGAADRFAVRNQMGAILGPNLGQLENVLKILNTAADQKLSESELRAMVRLIPFNNIWWLGSLPKRLYED